MAVKRKMGIMAVKLTDEFGSRANPSSAAYPNGSLKDETNPGVSNDGSPLSNRVGNDFQGFMQSALAEAGIDANGNPDSVDNPQILNSLKEVIGNHINAHGVALGEIGRVLDGEVFPNSEQFASAGDTVPSGTLFIKTNNATKWIALVDELPALPQEITSITDYEVTFTNGYSSPLLPLTARFTNEVTFEMFGANRNSVILTQ